MNSQLDALREVRSELLDADYALESSNLMKSQIQQQAQIAALTQANLSQRTVLELLNRA
jgi:flagellin